MVPIIEHEQLLHLRRDAPAALVGCGEHTVTRDSGQIAAELIDPGLIGILELDAMITSAQSDGERNNESRVAERHTYPLSSIGNDRASAHASSTSRTSSAVATAPQLPR